MNDDINCCSIWFGLFVLELSPVAVALAALLAEVPSNCANVDRLLFGAEVLPLAGSADSR